MNKDEQLEQLIETSKEVGKLTERKRIVGLLAGIAVETKNGEIAVMELLSAIQKLIYEEQK